MGQFTGWPITAVLSIETCFLAGLRRTTVTRPSCGSAAQLGEHGFDLGGVILGVDLSDYGQHSGVLG